MRPVWYQHHKGKQWGYVITREQETYKIAPRYSLGSEVCHLRIACETRVEGFRFCRLQFAIIDRCKGMEHWSVGALKTLESHKLKFPSRAKLCSEKKLLGVESKLNWTPSTPPKKGAKEREVPNKKDEEKGYRVNWSQEIQTFLIFFFFITLWTHQKRRRKSMRAVKLAERSWSTHFT